MVKKYMDETKKGFMQNIGDLSFKKIDENYYEFSIKVEEKFLNTGKIAHGGFIATIADTGMGNAAHIVHGTEELSQEPQARHRKTKLPTSKLFSTPDQRRAYRLAPLTDKYADHATHWQFAVWFRVLAFGACDVFIVGAGAAVPYIQAGAAAAVLFHQPLSIDFLLCAASLRADLEHVGSVAGQALASITIGRG